MGEYSGTQVSQYAVVNLLWKAATEKGCIAFSSPQARKKSETIRIRFIASFLPLGVAYFSQKPQQNPTRVKLGEQPSSDNNIESGCDIWGHTPKIRRVFICKFSLPKRGLPYKAVGPDSAVYLNI
jgi:hypothetical protein